MDMKYIFDIQNGEEQLNAGTKAPKDVVSILYSDGYNVYHINTNKSNSLNSLLYCFCAFFNIVVSIPFRSLVVIQYPIYSKWSKALIYLTFPFLKAKKTVLVALVHDIPSLRSKDGYFVQDLNQLKRYSYIVVHSNRMGELLKEISDCVKIRVLGLFDYLVSSKDIKDRTLSSEICFAGNLANRDFIVKFDDIICADNNLKLYLYGSFTPQINSLKNVVYRGKFLSDDVSSLAGSWGLVWDGPEIKECCGVEGDYLRYISPHKASLYLVAGLPLIVSSTSAIAEIVSKHEIGIVVNDLSNISNVINGITEEQYKTMLGNVSAYSLKLKQGGNTLDVLNQIAKEVF